MSLLLPFTLAKLNEIIFRSRATFRLKFGHWWPAIENSVFDLDSCSNGSITWHWYNSHMISKFALHDLLLQKRIKVREEFFEFQALIPKYLKKLL